MSTLYVTSTGGHLSELLRLADRLGPCSDDLWVTHDSPQSRAALHDRAVLYVPEVAPRRVDHLLRAAPWARRVGSGRRPVRVVSAGAGIALAFLPYLRARGVRCHYVESATRVHGPSLTGRLLALVPGVRTYCQYPGWADGRWIYAGNEFDAFHTAARRREPGGRLRVLVLLGTGPEPFDRMLRPIAKLLAPAGPLERLAGRPVQTVWQIGRTPCPDLGPTPAAAMTPAELDVALARTDVVISHAGVGCTLAALRAGLPPILIARRPPRETPDAHQAQFAAEIAARGLGRAVAPELLDAATVLDTLNSTVVEAAPAPFLLRGE